MASWSDPILYKIFKEKDKIYYVAIKDIEVGQALKVWYCPYYASKLNKPIVPTSNTETLPQELDPDAMNALIKAQQRIVDRKSWTCKFCSFAESNLVEFASHVLKHYSAQRRKICEICNTSFIKRKDLNKHLAFIHKPYLLTTKPKPSSHSKEHDPFRIQDVVLGGPLPNDIFTDSLELSQVDLNLNNHNLLLDNDNLIVENLDSENVKNLDHFNFEIDDTQKQFVCDICLRQFTKLKLLITHLKQHTGEFTCLKCLKIFCRRENFKAHVCNSDGFRFKCPLCEKSFGMQKYLSRHLEAHHNEKFKCTACKKNYFSNKELLEHNCSKVPNSEKETFTCPHCSKKFFRNRYLKKHLATHETRTKKIIKAICDKCGLHLTKDAFYLHQRKHEEATYSCQICDKKFHRQDTLNDHILSHQTVCELQCNICDKKLKTLKTLKLHKRTHEQQKQVKCPICDRSFPQTTLTKHIHRIHNENNIVRTQSFICPVCDKSVKLRSSLLRHMKRLHNMNQAGKSLIEQKISSKKTNLQESEQESGQKSEEENGQKSEEENAQKSEEESEVAEKECAQNQTIDKLVQDLGIDDNEKLDSNREVCLSIPDLTENDQEITLDKNAYILENGTIVQPQGNSDSIIIYVLDHKF